MSVAPTARQRAEARAYNEVKKHVRAATIRECLAWLAVHCETYKPEYLAKNMADDLGLDVVVARKGESP